jgi:hypothetical protein
MRLWNLGLFFDEPLLELIKNYLSILQISLRGFHNCSL